MSAAASSNSHASDPADASSESHEHPPVSSFDPHASRPSSRFPSLPSSERVAAEGTSFSREWGPLFICFSFFWEDRVSFLRPFRRRRIGFPFDYESRHFLSIPRRARAAGVMGRSRGEIARARFGFASTRNGGKKYRKKLPSHLVFLSRGQRGGGGGGVLPH